MGALAGCLGSLILQTRHPASEAIKEDIWSEILFKLVLMPKKNIQSAQNENN